MSDTVEREGPLRVGSKVLLKDRLEVCIRSKSGYLSVETVAHVSNGRLYNLVGKRGILSESQLVPIEQALPLLDKLEAECVGRVRGRFNARRRELKALLKGITDD